MVLGVMQQRVIGWWLINERMCRFRIKFASSKHMSLRSTFFQHAHRLSFTWRHPRGDSKSQIGHFLIDGKHFSDIIDIKTFRGANVDFDLFLVMVKLRQKLRG